MCRQMRNLPLIIASVKMRNKSCGMYRELYSSYPVVAFDHLWRSGGEPRISAQTLLFHKKLKHSVGVTCIYRLTEADIKQAGCLMAQYLTTQPACVISKIEKM